METSVIRFHQTGGPEVLTRENIQISLTHEDEVLVNQEIIGINFIDTYYRSGLYPTSLPSGLGFEAAGTVESVGAHVTSFKVGDRVAYAQGPLGSYAKKRFISERFLVKIPEGISFEQAASVMLKGLTVSYLFQETYPLKKGDTILFHAAAGGVGLIACQWAKSLGVKLIGTVSSDEKGKLALEHGASHVINYRKENVVDKVLEITKGEKLPVVFDGVGKETWTTSLDCLRPRGLMVSFGNASGAVTGVNLSELATRGSLYVTRPMLWAYMDTPEKLREASAQLFDLMLKGVIKVDGDQIYPMADVVRAHQELTNRDRVGALLLRP